VTAELLAQLTDWLTYFSKQVWTRELDFSLPRPFAPGSESFGCGTFAPLNFRTLYLSLPPLNTARSLFSVTLSVHLLHIMNDNNWDKSTECNYKTSYMGLDIPNIFGFVVTQRRVFLPLFVWRQAASPSAQDVRSQPGQTLRVLGHVCGRRPDHVRVTAQVFPRIRPGQPVITLTLH